MPQDLSAVTWPVRTERLTIRPATADDVDATWAYRRVPEVSEWLTGAITDRDEYAEMFLADDRLASTLVIERDGVAVGDLMLRIESPWAQHEVADQARDRQAELGWVIAPEHAGQGYATEAAAALLGICFDDLGLYRVTALCFADNVASWRIMERIGMRREAYNVRESLHRDRGWLDGLGYALLADEWRAARR
ncbi:MULTISPECIES: GNAT family N-acetyltransferase [unclassified Nocardioides]|uniref:GNAT family N-acetyltransferase n=1 Tax=unclassified Nocardioides TaxID=2615069 RepID=UPI003614091B